MSRQKDLPCSRCGELMWRGKGVLPVGQATCSMCRRRERERRGVAHGTPSGYRTAKCRCDLCRAWLRESMRTYCKGRAERDGMHPTTLYRQRNGGKRTTYDRNCNYCGTPFTTRSKGTLSCSVSCGHWFRHHGPALTSKELVRTTPRRPERAPSEPAHIRTARRLTSGQCRVCESWFVSLHLDVTCSARCKEVKDRELKRQHKDKRRAVKAEAYRADVHRRRVFEADGYRCHLCKRKTDPAKAAPHPRAPTIDHVIPLSKGGTHEPSNCRTACFLCNSSKGDRGGGEQLLLIAV